MCKQGIHGQSSDTSIVVSHKSGQEIVGFSRQDEKRCGMSPFVFFRMGV
jgi:hypothetical protein